MTQEPRLEVGCCPECRQHFSYTEKNVAIVQTGEDTYGCLEYADLTICPHCRETVDIYPEDQEGLDVGDLVASDCDPKTIQLWWW